MPAVEPLYHLIGINDQKLTQAENHFLELELFVRICDELKEIFREQHREYFRLMKFSIQRENDMLETKFVRLIIQDILSTNEYDLKGIAHYTNSFEDVVEEVIAGRNISPSATFLRRIVELHRSVRRDLYIAIMQKITTKFIEAIY